MLVLDALCSVFIQLVSPPLSPLHRACTSGTLHELASSLASALCSASCVVHRPKGDPVPPPCAADGNVSYFGGGVFFFSCPSPFISCRSPPTFHTSNSASLQLRRNEGRRPEKNRIKYHRNSATSRPGGAESSDYTPCRGFVYPPFYGQPWSSLPACAVVLRRRVSTALQSPPGDTATGWTGRSVASSR